MKYNVINNENNYLFERYQSVDKNKREKMDLFSNKSALKKSNYRPSLFTFRFKLL